MISRSQGTDNCKMLGIMVRYCCPGETEPVDVWVDLRQVGGLVWSHNTEGFSDDRAIHNPDAMLPRFDHEPTCTGPRPMSLTTVTGSGVCWWDGSQWICCD